MTPAAIAVKDVHPLAAYGADTRSFSLGSAGQPGGVDQSKR